MAIDIDHRANLSYQDFAAEYLFPNRPVVVTDALRRWRALSRWTPEFFRTEFGKMTFLISDHENGQAGYHEKGGVEYTMAQFIDSVLVSTDEHPAPYFRNRILDDLFPSLSQDIEPMPEYVRPNWLRERYLVKYVGEVLNRGAAIELYIGGTGGAFPVLHYDGAGTHAFLMQIYGRKRFILYPPDQEAYLYPSAQKQNCSTINSVDRPDLDRFPLFARAVPTTFVLEPGELVFVPCGWWHTTKMLTPSITISINVANRSNWRELVNFVSMRRRNPFVSLASRVYLTGAGAWRAWREGKWSTQSGQRDVSPRAPLR